MGEPKLRLRRIMDPASGKFLLLTFTMSMEAGPVPGLTDLPEMIATLDRGFPVTGVVVHAGVMDTVFARCPRLRCGAIVELMGGTWLTSRPDQREQICSLEHAVRVGADAVMATIGMGSPGEGHHLRLCGQIARECRDWGIPFVIRIDTLATDARRQFSATMSGHGARMAYELGADAVVINYPDTPGSFAEVLHGVDIPVLIGGGPSIHTDEALLQTSRDAVAAGASGVAFSAPMFWNQGPTDTLSKLAETIGVRRATC